MADDMREPNTGLIPRPDSQLQIQDFERRLLSVLGQYGLPTQSIFVPALQREVVFRNIGGVIDQIDQEKRSQSVYISKFVAACASGLFDAALNYLWDETIFELRKCVAKYDLSYFYDNAVTNPEKRKRLNNEEDLAKLDDSELIHGAREIGLISELGFKHLDLIRYMRNYASAAHPNQNELTGLQIVSWLETCVREVISLPLPETAMEIRRLLSNIKSNNVSEEEARQVGTIFLTLTQEQVNNLASGLFGIYTRQETTSQTRQNIHRLLPLLWDRVDEPTREQFGIKYRRFVANNDQDELKWSRQFLQVVSAVSYIPNDLRIPEIEYAIENLLAAHRSYDNFQNEPPFARELRRVVGEQPSIPPSLNKKYADALVEAFLTNGNGVTYQAEPTYKSLLDQFTSTQAFLAIISFSDLNIASKLQFKLCAKKFSELLDMMKNKVSSAAARELIEAIESYSGRFEALRDDPRMSQRVDTTLRILM